MVAQAINFLAECSVVFANPDNGLVCDDPENNRQKKFGKQIPLGDSYRQNQTQIILSPQYQNTEAMTWKWGV